jgi:hypothetical protein
MILTSYFLNKKIKALTKNASKRVRCYRSLSDIRHILVMCEAKDWKSVHPCIRSLKEMGKTVHVCVYTRKIDQSPIWDYAYLLVEARNDINLWGFPNKNIKSKLNALTVDMLLDLTSGEIPAVCYLMLQQPASFKVGAKRSSEDGLHDFSIIMKDGVHDIPFLFEQIINYLQMIRSK